ncbi:IQ motif and ubiquitin-like domain-containing protein isoform X2 [Hydra vulgaris]|uniref:IQ motif and ubiquitin-like domain-containing protein isoform X2 n=1 Tax=Hydra vulgaris TaxID=6087 RepID=UPI001F5E59C3|nr:IQ and ubiquitin-like domain-containing protein isoform X2 [Hydra vulgaris]
MISEGENEFIIDDENEKTQKESCDNNEERIVANLYKKPFLGGFRHKVTGLMYLNASSQTNTKKYIHHGLERFDRDTQTVQSKNQILQTYCDTSTQMTKPGCYIAEVTDKIIIPGKYITAAEKEKDMLEKVILLQCYWRRWLAKQLVNNLRSDQEQRIKWEKEVEEKKVADRADRLRQEFERRMNPQTNRDFDLLYAALEKWRKEEILSIDLMHSGSARKAALIGLLEQESYLIQSIERHRINANSENLQEHILLFLKKAAKPKFWRAFDGGKTEMYTNNTLRAEKLRDLYNSLQMNYLTQGEREDVLCTLKQTVQEYKCKLTEEIVELVNREINLLTRGVKEKNLEGLRLRISTLFLQFCKNPQYNPEVARLLKVPNNPLKLLKNIFFCPSCNSYLPSSEFPLASNSKIAGRCSKCVKLDNTARLRHDFSKIHFMLLQIRLSEESFDDGSQIPYLMQDADLQYLVEIIWNSQSALSGVSEISELILVRWNKHKHWSPWNCVLLSKDESIAHLKLDNTLEAYGRIFIGKVKQKHLLAKNYFAKLFSLTNKNNLKLQSEVSEKRDSL